MTETGAPVAHLLIESQGNWTGPNAARFATDAAVLAEDGQGVTLFLVADGVFAAVAGSMPEIDRVAAAGGQVWADRFSLEQRALTAAKLSANVSVVEMDAVAGELLDRGCRVVWH